ncbi:MAG: RNA methyltransferase [Acidobacteria bacterium]|nr:MAG: RNA methyltransferase [Acidobacteriota bacterium]
MKSKPPRESPSLAVGFQAVRSALERTPARVERVLLARGQRDARTRLIVALCRERGVPFGPAPREALDRLAGGVVHQGLIARLSGTDLIALDELIDRLPERPLLVALDGVVDPRNLGAVVRSAAGLGAAGVLIPGHGSAGMTPAAVKTAAGAAALVPIARASNLGRALDRLAEEGIEAVALDTEGAAAPWEVDLTRSIVLVAGGEQKGIRPGVRRRCPAGVTVPLEPGVGSLNVAAAVTAVLAEARRQRLGGRPRRNAAEEPIRARDLDGDPSRC